MNLDKGDIRISLIGTVILAILTVAAGTLTYLVMQAEARSILKRNVSALLQNDARFFRQEIQRDNHLASVVATRPFVVDNMRKTDAHPRNRRARHNLRRVARSFLSLGLTAVTFYDARGRLVAHAGRIDNPPFVVPLHGRREAFLLWNRHPMVRTVMPIRFGRRRLGSVITQGHVAFAGKMAPIVRALGRTADLKLCAPVGPGSMRCLPDTRLARHTDHPVPEVRDGHRLPMWHALRGATGYVYARDRGGHAIIAAYTPVPHTGLGMVLTIRQSDLFRDITARLVDVGAILLLLLVTGMVMMRWLVLPLLRRRTEAEQQTQMANIRLRNSEAQIQGLLGHMADGVIVINEDGLIQIFNSACERIFGYKTAEMIGQNVCVLMPEPHRSAHDAYLQHYLETGEAKVLSRSRELLGVRKDGQQFPLEIRVSEVRNDSMRLFIATVRDVTLEKAEAQKALYLATHDALTQIPNRLLLGERLQQALSAARRTDGKVALFFLDLDGFKGINDRLGHDIGDALLRIVAQRLTASLRADDTVARLGGDEFVIILTGALSRGNIEAVGRKLLAAIRTPYMIQGHTLYVGTSIGIALFPDDGTDSETLLKNGDIAMYRAKEAGGNRFHFFASDVRAYDAPLSALSADWLAARGHGHGHLRLLYQPVRSLADDTVASLDVLVVWQHATRGLLGQDTILRVAEETGTIVPLGTWILQTACTQWRNWTAEGAPAPPLSLSWTAAQWQQDAQVHTVQKILAECRMPADHLIMGIGENLITEHDGVGGALQALRALDVQIAIDGFGAGLSSLTSLRRLSPQILRMDPWIVHGLATSEGETGLLKAIIALAHSLRMTVVAKGVRNDVQRLLLRELGCDAYQGDEWDQPLSAEETAAFLQQNAPHCPA